MSPISTPRPRRTPGARLQAQGFQPLQFRPQRRLSAAGLGRGHVSEIDSRTICRKRNLLRDHRKLGCISLVVEKDGIVSPFVFKPRLLDRPPVPVMDVIYCPLAPTISRRCGAGAGAAISCSAAPWAS